MSDTSLDAARTRYLHDLQLVHPLYDDQLSEVLVLLRSLLGEHHPSVDNRLDIARADYLARLRDRYRTLDQQLLELATAGTHLFGPALGLTSTA